MVADVRVISGIIIRNFGHMQEMAIMSALTTTASVLLTLRITLHLRAEEGFAKDLQNACDRFVQRQVLKRFV